MVSLKDFPKPYTETKAVIGTNIQRCSTTPKEYEEWKVAFEKQLHSINLRKWLDEHGYDYITAHVLKLFIETEIRGEK